MYKYAGLIITAIGGLLTIIGGVVSTIQQFREDNKSSADTINFQKELNKKSDEITELSKNNAALATGGNGFCFLSPHYDEDKEEVSFSIVNPSDFPQYDVTVQMLKLARDKYQKTISAGNVPNKTGQRFLVNAPLSKSESDAVFIIQIAARNGLLFQEVRCKKIAGKWKISLKVMRGEEILIHAIEPDVPLLD